MLCMRALVSCSGVGSTTTDRNKLTANNADWLRRAILKTFYYPQSHLAQTLYFVAKSLRRNGWFADSFVRGQLTWLGWCQCCEGQKGDMDVSFASTRRWLV